MLVCVCVCVCVCVQLYETSCFVIFVWNSVGDVFYPPPPPAAHSVSLLAGQPIRATDSLSLIIKRTKIYFTDIKVSFQVPASLCLCPHERARVFLWQNRCSISIQITPRRVYIPRTIYQIVHYYYYHYCYCWNYSWHNCFTVERLWIVYYTSITIIIVEYAQYNNIYRHFAINYEYNSRTSRRM